MATAHIPNAPGFDTKSLVGTGRDAPVPCWIPNTDVLAHEAGVTVIVELAGMRREDVDLEVTGSRLRIRGRREKGPLPLKAKYFVMEIPDGGFDFVVDLPAGLDATKGRAAYLNGFLRVDLPHDQKEEGDSTKIVVGAPER